MDDQPSGTGYTWLEFGRLNRDGDEPREEFLTLGMGIRAVRGGPLASWFFVTPRRVDESLSLKSADGVPLTRRQLAEALADEGQVLETASEYRRVVDEKLFRLGDRYEPLIDLLLQLRQPQLAKKLDIDQLEAALRGALPPLKEALLVDAAEAFRDLDHYRTALAADRQLLSDIERFMRPYQDHVRRGVLRAARQLTQANSSYEAAQKRLRSLGEQQEQDKRTQQELHRRRQANRIAEEQARAAISELEQSPEMRDARRLDELRSRAGELANQAAEGERDVHIATQEQSSAAEQMAKLQAGMAEQLNRLTSESTAISKAAAPEALQNQHRELLANCLSQSQLLGIDEALERLAESAARYAKSASHLQKLDGEIAAAAHQRDAARREVERCADAAQQRSEALRERTQACGEVVEATWQAILAWYESAGTLHEFLPPAADWMNAWHAWVESPEQPERPDPSVEYLRFASVASAARSAQQKTQAQAAIEQVEAAIAIAGDEIARLESGEAIVPPPRSGRDPAARQSLVGAPFWQLVEFRYEVPPAEHAGWEAALEDAGILDAWVTSDGRLLAGDGPILEVQLDAGGGIALAAERQLNRVLQVVDPLAAQIEPRVLERILSVIGVGADAGSTWIASDGSWQNGPLRGQWSKPVPQYVGETHRQRYRELRLQTLAAEVREQSDARDQLRRELQRIGADREQAEARIASFPGNQALQQATFEVTTAQRESNEAQDRHVQSTQREAQCVAEVQRREAERDAVAADFGLSAWATRAMELANRLNAYQHNLSSLKLRSESLLAAREQSARGEQAHERAAERLTSAARRWEAFQVDLGKQRQRVAELEFAVGKDAGTIIQRLEDKRRDLSTSETNREQIASEISAVEQALAVTASKLETENAAAGACDQERREASDWFSSLHGYGFVALAVADIPLTDLPWSMTQAIRIARQADTALAETPADDESWHKSQNRVHQSQALLQQTVLSQNGLRVEVDHLRDGLQLVTLTMQHERLAPALAIARLNADVASRERILDEKEQETLEKYLLGEVAEGLRVGMRMAAELVDLMTKEVSSRPMKTGLQMRFKWRQDEAGPPGLAEACEVLATSHAIWSEADREQIKQFLQRSIKASRESDATGSWHEHLRAALDYRLWHRIAIERRSGPDAPWKRLTRQTYGSGSGGEKAISLTLPQLAAAAAYYHTADKLAPRFILLDEAFAGVSPDMRESCLELIAAFKLDVVMTSEIEWGMYPGVRQLSICQLDRFADLGAVVNRVFLWNGRELRDASPRDAHSRDERANDRPAESDSLLTDE
jgi:uncharacterized protein (TIGR02680 family)